MTHNDESYQRFQRERIEAAKAHDAEAAVCLTCAANHYCPKHNPDPRWPPGLLDRIKAAERRVQDNRAPRSIPADPNSDVDLVLAEVRYLIEGKWPPFWIKDADAGVMFNGLTEAETNETASVRGIVGVKGGGNG